MSYHDESGGEVPTLNQIAESIKEHDSALQALKDVPLLLQKLTSAMDGTDNEDIDDLDDQQTDQGQLNPVDILGEGLLDYVYWNWTIEFLFSIKYSFL